MSHREGKSDQIVQEVLNDQRIRGSIPATRGGRDMDDLREAGTLDYCRRTPTGAVYKFNHVLDFVNVDNMM